MSASQQILKAILPASTFAAVEAESRLWVLKCSNCNHERSLWDAGGARFGAAGRPRRYMKCPNCGKRSWQELYKKSSA